MNGATHFINEDVTEQVFSLQLSQHSSMPGTVETVLGHAHGEQNSQRHLEIHTAEIKTRINKEDDQALSRQHRANSSSIKTGGTERNLSNSKQFNFESQLSNDKVDQNIQDGLGSEHASGGWKSDRSPQPSMDNNRHSKQTKHLDQSTLTVEKSSQRRRPREKNPKLEIMYHIQTKERIVEKNWPNVTVVPPKVYNNIRLDHSIDLQRFPQRQVKRQYNMRGLNARQIKNEDPQYLDEVIETSEGNRQDNSKATSTINDDLRNTISSPLQTKPNSPSVSSSMTNRWPVGKILKQSFYGSTIHKMNERVNSPPIKPSSPQNISLVAPSQHLDMKERTASPLNLKTTKPVKQQPNQTLKHPEEYSPKPDTNIIPNIRMAINNFSQSFESEELLKEHKESSSTKRIYKVKRLKHSVPIRISKDEETDKNVDTQTQMRNVSPQLGGASSKGNVSPQLVNDSEEQLISTQALQKEIPIEENIDKTIASGSCVVEYKQGDGHKPLTAQFSIPEEVGRRADNNNFEDKASTKYRRTATNVGGITEHESQIVSEAVISSEYNDQKMYEHIQVTEESQSGKSENEVGKIVVVTNQSSQPSSRDQFPRGAKSINKQLNTRSGGVDLPKINKRLEKSHDSGEQVKNQLNQLIELNTQFNNDTQISFREESCAQPSKGKIDRGSSNPQYQLLKGQVLQDVSEAMVMPNSEANKKRKFQRQDRLVFSGYRDSIYTKDKSRIAQLYTNQDRIAQILNPTMSVRDKPPQILPADKSHMAEVHKMFLPATVRNKVMSPVRGAQKKTAPDRRTMTIQDQETLDLPASMKRKGLRGRTLDTNARALQPQAYYEPIHMEDRSKYRTVDMGASFKKKHKQDAQSRQGSTDQSALRQRLQKQLQTGLPKPLNISRQSIRTRDYAIKHQIGSISPWRRNKASRLGTGDDLFNSKGDFSPTGFPPKTRDSMQEESIISYQAKVAQGRQSASRETPPKIVNKVQEWLTDQNQGQLVLERYQEVAVPRASRSKQYRAKAGNPGLRLEEQAIAYERIPTEIASQVRDNESKRGTAMESFKNRNPSQLQEKKQRFSVMHTDQIREKNSVQIANEDVSPLCPEVKNQKKIVDPKLSMWSNQDSHTGTESRSKSRNQSSPLNMQEVQAMHRTANIGTGGAERKRQNIHSDSKSIGNFSDNQSPTVSPGADSSQNLGRSPVNYGNAQYAQKQAQNVDFTITILSQKVKQQREAEFQNQNPTQNQNSSPRTQQQAMENFQSQNENVHSTVHSNESMSPRWGPRAKGMTIIRGRENATPTKISEEKLPRVVGGMKAMNIREAKDSKLSNNVKTSNTNTPTLSPEKSEAVVTKTQNTVQNTLTQQNSRESGGKMLLDSVSGGSKNAKPAQQTVLTRLLKGQNSQNQVPDDSLTSEGAPCVDFKELANMNRVVHEPASPRSFYFQLNTLYESQKARWRKFDYEYARFEEDHLNNQPPIPPSAQFLLIHTMQKIQKMGFLKRLAPESPFNHQSHQGVDRSKSPDRLSFQGQLNIEIMDEKEALFRQKAAKGQMDGLVQRFVLQEALKLSKLQLQMCCQSVLTKSKNADKGKLVFDDMKLQLQETYNQLEKHAI